MLVNHANGYIECNSVEEKNGNKYLIFDHSVNENKKVLKKYKIKLKLKFRLTFRAMTIIIRSVEEDGKFYWQAF